LEDDVFTRMRRWFRAVGNGGRLDDQMDQELAFHLDLEAAKLERHGLSAEAARTEARRAFGGVERVREEVRDTRRTSWVDTLLRNLRYARRSLGRNPGYTAAVLATLGLGIGANTTMFSVIDGVLLKPLPYEGSDRLVLLRQSSLLAGQDDVLLSIPELYGYREQLASDFEGLVEFHQMSFDLIKRGDPNRVAAGVVSANFFDVLRVKPILGRTFQAADAAHGAPAVLLLSNAYWKSRFGAAPDIVGQVFEMNDRPHTVVGVLPPVPIYPQESDVYMPTSACPFRARGEEHMAANWKSFSNLRVFGRLKPGVTIEAASAHVATVAAQFTREHAEAYRDARGFGASALGLLGELTRNARPMLLILVGATALVLLLACANVASLTLARTVNRDRELALRTALGAGRRQLAGQLLTESVLLAVGGGIAGLLLAATTQGALGTFIGRFTARAAVIAIDGRVLAFTAIVSILTGVAFGALPAFVTRVDPASALRQSGASASGPRQPRLLRGLVVAQVAVSVVLLAAAGLFMTSLYRLARVDAGYHAERVLSAQAFGNFTRYKTPEDFLRLYRPLLERLSATPGVQSAAVGTVVPLAQQGQPFLSPFEIQGRSSIGRDRPAADVNVVSTRYFETLGVPILGGRDFRATDTKDATPVTVINQSMARYWDGADPVGSRVSFDQGEHWFTVVGVTSTVRQYGLERDGAAQLFIALEQSPFTAGASVLIRTTADPVSMAQVLRETVHSLDPDMPVEHVETLEALRSDYLAPARLTAMLLGLFAGVAFVVTLAGLTGVIAMSVSQRTQEFGVRMALGAQPASILTAVVRQGLVMVAIGLAIGGAASMLVGRFFTSYLYETRPTDPTTLGVVAIALLAAAAVACAGPARRATRVDPILALRSE
jgi:putative ABC transport system permease protein